MTLALFDLDHTLLSGDSDQLWGDFLRQRGLVDADYQQEKDRHFADYRAGRLDIAAFAALVLGPLRGRHHLEWLALRDTFAASHVAPALRRDAVQQIAAHRARGHRVVIVTATNRFVAKAAADVLGIADLLASEPAVQNDHFTGALDGVACFREGKIEHVQRFCAAHGHTLEGSYFYSDSHNDLPLLRVATHPHAVTPDAQLRAIAEQENWPILEWQ